MLGCIRILYCRTSKPQSEPFDFSLFIYIYKKLIFNFLCFLNLTFSSSTLFCLFFSFLFFFFFFNFLTSIKNNKILLY